MKKTKCLRNKEHEHEWDCLESNKIEDVVD